MATYSNNTTIKISQAISATASFSSPGGTQTLYTCPANRYAKVFYTLTANSDTFGPASISISCGGFSRGISKAQNTGSLTYPAQDASGNGTNELIVGPGQSVIAQGQRGSVGIVGVEFVNTP